MLTFPTLEYAENFKTSLERSSSFYAFTKGRISESAVPQFANCEFVSKGRNGVPVGDNDAFCGAITFRRCGSANTPPRCGPPICILRRNLDGPRQRPRMNRFHENPQQKPDVSFRSVIPVTRIRSRSFLHHVSDKRASLAYQLIENNVAVYNWRSINWVSN